MTHRIVALTLIAIVCLAARVPLDAQRSVRPPRRPPPDATASIVGRVFDANTKQPVRRAQIEATNKMLFLDAMTDEEGRFQILNVPAGEWEISVQKGGYFPWHVGQKRPFQNPDPIRIAARQRVSAEVPLSRGGVIAGRVSDESGEPLAGLQVKVYRARMAQGYRRLESVGSADRTDDTGAYRIYGLPPGDYYVAASLRVAGADSVVETTYSPTYYPGTGDLGEAQRIRVGLGTEATAIFLLMPVRSVRVTGTVQTSSGAPADAFLNLTSENSEFGIPLGIGGVTRRGGTFLLPDVPPGRYMLTAELRGDGAKESASMPIVVSNEDLQDVSLVTEQPGRIRGRFVLDAGVTRALPEELEITAMSTRANGTVLSHGTGATFELGELNQPFFLRINAPQGWSVTRIVMGGADVTDSKAIVVPLGQQGEVRVVLTDRTTVVSGRVAKEGQSMSGDVVVFPADPARWGFPSRYVRHVEADDRGRFRVAGLPPYERYLAVATDYLETGEENDPEFLEHFREQALPFSLGAADTRTLDLPLIER